MLAPEKRPDLPVSLTAAILRGAKGQCPRCGEARLFRAYLKPVDHCPACHQDWTHQRADDFPPYISIFLTGHLMAPLIIYFGAESPLPMWLALTICLVAAAVMMLAFLQPAKGGTVALQWWHGMHGFVPSGHDEARGPASPAAKGPWQR
ncbi:DUF983 domain-containing protein [Novosphingobium sp.]|uniref:DUF983 domain-containing protein n=1 Tax=Novosphingobium sp. TaxID=1874826 RepID=UPI0025FAC10D|nr:DUF983 domain-containing protein [Novosphingobium sp.]MCC6924414.1 DUF983 domain-containing protein [Novosphingobium sp.]